MANTTTEPQGQSSLRESALDRLNLRREPGDLRANASAALGVLYELASSQSTAADAQVLLHELQVHQVELELQDEELRRSRIEVEEALARQIQLYDHAPVGYCTIDERAILCELNATGARLLGFERAELLGRALDGYLSPESGRLLHAMLARIAGGGQAQACALELRARGGAMKLVHAAAAADPTGGHFLVTLQDMGKDPGNAQ